METLDYMESWITAKSVIKGNLNNPNSREGHPSARNHGFRRTSPLKYHGSFHRGLMGRKLCLLFIQEMSRKAFIKTLKSRSKVAATTLELIYKEQSRTQSSFIYLRNDVAKGYKTQVLQDFLRQERISHWATERTSLDQMDWLRDSTSPSSTSSAACLSMELDS